MRLRSRCSYESDYPPTNLIGDEQQEGSQRIPTKSDLRSVCPHDPQPQQVLPGGRAGQALKYKEVERNEPEDEETQTDRAARVAIAGNIDRIVATDTRVARRQLLPKLHDVAGRWVAIEGNKGDAAVRRGAIPSAVA